MCTHDDLNYIAHCLSKYSQFISEPILDVGSYNVNGNSRIFFPDKEWIGLDFRAGPDVTRVENIEETTLASNSVGAVICTATLEHVKNPVKACEQIHHVLKKNGLFVLTVPFVSKIHNHPDDYWRFTPSCVRNILLEKFIVLEVVQPKGKIVYGCAIK